MDKFTIEEIINELKNRGIEVDEQEKENKVLNVTKSSTSESTETEEKPKRGSRGPPKGYVNPNKPKTKVQSDWEEFGPALYNDFINNKLKIAELMVKYDRKKYTVSELIKRGKKEGLSPVSEDNKE